MAPLLNSNLQAFNLTVSTLLKNPSHLVPNLTIPTFLDLPENLGPHLVSSAQHQSSKNPEYSRPPRHPTIRALVLDKDNTLCPPKTIVLPKPYLRKLESLRTSPTSPFNQKQNPHGILIVSNTAGSRPDSAAYEAEARDLEERLHIPVFRVRAGRPRKPFCGTDVLAWFREHGVVEGADEIAVVGDRIGTDTLMAAQMGAWSVWCKEGVRHGVDTEADERGDRDYRGLLAKMEVLMESYLRENRGLKARVPRGWEQ
jgi:phosphatidylglycerophosphatase GEP4